MMLYMFLAMMPPSRQMAMIFGFLQFVVEVVQFCEWLAGPDVPPAHYLPLGVSILPSDPLPAIPPPGSERLRDGLRRFDPALFLDPQLAATDPRLLLDEADWIRYRSPNPRACAARMRCWGSTR